MKKTFVSLEIVLMNEHVKSFGHWKILVMVSGKLLPRDMRKPPYIVTHNVLAVYWAGGLSVISTWMNWGQMKLSDYSWKENRALQKEEVGGLSDNVRKLI